MNQDLYNLVKQYSSNQMSEEERRNFEKRLENDADMAREAQEYALMIEAIDARGDEMLESELNEMGKKLILIVPEGLDEATKTPVRKLSVPVYVYAVAAVVLILILLLPFVFQSGPKPAVSSEDLFVSNFSMPAAPEARDAQSSWKDNYRNQNYKSVIIQLEEILQDSLAQTKSEPHFYLGVSYLADGQTDKALSELGKVSESYILFEDVAWYQALVYLKMGDKVKTAELLQEITNQERHPYKEEATDLLKGLK